ncbi:MAG: enoyl-CoA hydratase/isomerase family protein [Actinomycetota bacterium]
MSGGPVLFERTGHVATITLNRPDVLNAIDAELRQALNAAWLRFKEDDDAWVAILTGAGRGFCAGVDLRNPQGAVGSWPGTFWEIPTINSFESGLELWKPTIAAVNGPCIGYGLTGVAACDFVIASESATFGFPEVKLGTPTIVGAIRLSERLGWQNAMELLLTGDTIDAQHALEIGLAWKIVPGDQLLTEAVRLAERLCQGGPLAVRATKEVAWRSRYLSWTEAVRFGETMRRLVGASEDAREGAQARAEGREPRWHAR